MSFIDEIEKLEKKLKSEFPIESQSSDEDKVVLLELKNLM